MENPAKQIEIWRQPLRAGEVAYYFTRTHYGFDDVQGKAHPRGIVRPEVDADGWLCWSVPDNVFNRKLVKDGWSGPMYFVFYPETIEEKAAVLKQAKTTLGREESERARQKKETEVREAAAKLESEEAELAKKLESVRSMRQTLPPTQAEEEVSSPEPQSMAVPVGVVAGHAQKPSRKPPWMKG